MQRTLAPAKYILKKSSLTCGILASPRNGAGLKSCTGKFRVSKLNTAIQPDCDQARFRTETYHDSRPAPLALTGLEAQLKSVREKRGVIPPSVDTENCLEQSNQRMITCL